MAPWLLSNPRTPRHQKPVLQSYRLSSHLRETGRWPLRGEGEWRVGIRTCRQNPETVGPRPWISRLCSFQIRWATGSPLLCRCPARNLGFTESCDHWSRRRACATSGHAAAPPSNVMNSRRLTPRHGRLLPATKAKWQCWLSAKLLCDALRRASPDPEGPSHLQDTHAFRKLVSHLPFGRTIYLRPAEFHALRYRALETCFDPLTDIVRSNSANAPVSWNT